MLFVKKENYCDDEIKKELDFLSKEYLSFKSYESKEGIHGIHKYPAMMIYQLPRTLINIVKKYKKVDTIFDPFMGSGTVLVEGINAKIENVIGNDINPLAILIGKVKTTYIEKSVFDKKLNKLLINIENIQNQKIWEDFDLFIKEDLGIDITQKNGWGSNASFYLEQFVRKNNLKLEIPNFSNLGYWFIPSVIIQLSLIKDIIFKINDSDFRNFVLLCFSETVRNVSNRRKSEFKLYRIQKEKLYYYNPNVFKIFTNILIDNYKRYFEFWDRLKSNHASKVEILRDDVKYLKSIKNDFIDLLITSPPYGDSKTTVAYGQFSRLSLQWLNLYENDIDSYLLGGKRSNRPKEYDGKSLESKSLKFSLSKIKEIDPKRAKEVLDFYDDLNLSIESISKKMKKNGYQFWVVGNRTVKGITLKTDKIIKELSESKGLIHITTLHRNILNKVMPLLNSPSNSVGKKMKTMTNEYIVVLKKI